MNTTHHSFWRGWLLLAVALWMSFAPAAIAVGLPRFFSEKAPATGAEPSGSPGLHIYLYAKGSPLMFSDPSGHFSDVSLPALGAAVALVGALAYLAVPNVYHEFSSAVIQLSEIAIHRMLMTAEEIEGTIGDLISGGIAGKKSSSRQYIKPGGKTQQEKDFDGIPVPPEPKDGGVEVKTLPDGTKVIKRPSTEGSPTIEIQRPPGKAGNKTKIRYKEEGEPPPENNTPDEGSNNSGS